VTIVGFGHFAGIHPEDDDRHEDPPVRSLDIREQLMAENLAIRAENSARLGCDMYGLIERVTGDELAEIFSALVKAGDDPCSSHNVRLRALEILGHHAFTYAQQAIK